MLAECVLLSNTWLSLLTAGTSEVTWSVGQSVPRVCQKSSGMTFWHFLSHMICLHCIALGNIKLCKGWWTVLHLFKKTKWNRDFFKKLIFIIFWIVPCDHVGFSCRKFFVAFYHFILVFSLYIYFFSAPLWKSPWWESLLDKNYCYY